jgi:NADPH:quinone reductase-like Zn-dependent oxidoreductase
MPGRYFTKPNTSEDLYMNAITYNRYGDSSVLNMTRVLRPEPNDDQVLVKVYAAGLNPIGVYNICSILIIC